MKPPAITLSGNPARALQSDRGQAMPPAGEKTMRAQTESVSPIFQNSRRRSPGLVLGILLVLGYFGTAVVLIRDYSAAPSTFDQVA